MTFVGKLFVLLNVAVSFVMAFVAFGLYATGLDYDSETKGKGSAQPPARLTALKNEITTVVSTIPAVEGGWRAAHNELLLREEQRKYDHVWFDKQMAFARTAATAANPVRAVVIKDHLPVLGEKGEVLAMAPTVDRAGQPLQSLQAYTLQLEAARKDHAAVVEDLQKEIAKAVRLTHQMTGTTEPLDAESKEKYKVTPTIWRIGYRQLMVDERDKRQGVESEIYAVKPLFINTAVQSERIRKRLESMQERIEELKTYLRKRHKVDVAMRRR
jgi:hypothetical protein